MISLPKFLVLGTLCWIIRSKPIGDPDHNHDHVVDSLVELSNSDNWRQLSVVLDNVDAATLHQVLHEVHPKFRDGIFTQDRTALEQVHSENPNMAHKLVQIAKRQTDTPDNSTTTATSSGATVSPSTAQESSEAAASSSRAASVSSALVSALSSQLTATTLPPSTSVLLAPSSPDSATAVSTGDGGVVYSSDGGGVVTLTSTAIGVYFTHSTYTSLYYTTEQGGNQQTLTSVVVVNAPVTTTLHGSAEAAAATTSVALQNEGVTLSVSSMGACLLIVLGFMVAL